MRDIAEPRDFDMPFLAAIEQLLVAFAGERAAAELFETLKIEIIPVVVDADVLFRDIGTFLRKSKLTSLLIGAQSGFIRFFCSKEVLADVYDHLAERTSKHATEDEAFDVWCRYYEPLITALDHSDIDKLSLRAVRVQAVDPEDIGTAKVSDLVRPHQVLSVDHHLNHYHPGQDLTEKNWTEITTAYRDMSEGRSTFVSLYIGGGLSTTIAVTFIEALISRLLRMDGRILLALGLGLLLAGGVAIAHPTSRRWLKQRARDAREWSREYLAEHIREIIDALVSLDNQTKQAEVFLKEKALVHEPPLLARDYIIGVLAHTHAYLTTTEISERMQDYGYEPRGEHPEQYVAKILRENPRLFTKHTWRQWGLRSSTIDEVLADDY
jgi:hypothetical protein